MPLEFNQNINQENLMQLFAQLQNILNQDRTARDPLTNLSPFEVSATRGRAMFPMGGIAGSLPSIPASFALDTINNTPSNLPGGSAGKFMLSQLALQPNDVFTVPTSLPFNESIFGNKMLQPAPFHRMPTGGRVDKRLERLRRRQDRLNAKGKGDSRRGKNINDRIQDILSGGLGKTEFGTGLLQTGQGLGKGLSQLAPFLSFIPGIGTAGSALAGLAGAGLNSLTVPGSTGINPGNIGGTNGALGQLPFGLGPFDNSFTPSGSLLAPLNSFQPFNNPAIFGQPGLFGMPPFGATPGIAGPMFSPGAPSFQFGGLASIPIQTEEGEMIVLPNLNIVPTNADTTHEKMDKDVITDITPEGSYILSNDKKIRMKKKDAEDIIMEVRSEKYQEGKKGMIPEETSFAELWGKKTKDMTPAQLGEAIRRRYPIVDKKEMFGDSDIFTENTNQENLTQRLPWLDVVIGFNETEKQKKNPDALLFKKGGTVKRPLRLKNAIKAPSGMDVSQILNLLGTALPFVDDLFGGNNNSTIDPMARSMILGALPIDQAGFQANVNARTDAMNQGIADFTGLGQNLNQFALGTAGAGIMGNLLQNTDLPRFDFSSARSRLNNFNTTTPRTFAEALATPRFDTRAVLQELGATRGGTTLSALESERQRQFNQAMVNQFNQDRSLDFARTQGLNQLDIGEQDRNVPLGLQEIQARNAQTSGIFGQFGDLFNRFGQIQSEILPITTDLNLQRAGLVGTPGMRAAHNLLGVGTTLASADPIGTGTGVPSTGLFGSRPGGTAVGNFIRKVLGAPRPEIDVPTTLPTPLGPVTGVCQDPLTGLPVPC